MGKGEEGAGPQPAPNSCANLTIEEKRRKEMHVPETFAVACSGDWNEHKCVLVPRILYLC